MKWNEIFYISGRDNWYFLDYYQCQHHFRMASFHSVSSHFPNRLAIMLLLKETLVSIAHRSIHITMLWNGKYLMIRLYDIIEKRNRERARVKKKERKRDREEGKGRQNVAHNQFTVIQPWMCSIDKRISNFIFIIIINNIAIEHTEISYSNPCIKILLEQAVKIHNNWFSVCVNWARVDSCKRMLRDLFDIMKFALNIHHLSRPHTNNREKNCLVRGVWIID